MITRLEKSAVLCYDKYRKKEQIVENLLLFSLLVILY